MYVAYHFKFMLLNYKVILNTGAKESRVVHSYQLIAFAVCKSLKADNFSLEPLGPEPLDSYSDVSAKGGTHFHALTLK